MRHLNKNRKLNRSSSHRQALQRNILVSLFTHGKIITLRSIAKQYSAAADKLITLAKRADLKIAEMTKKLNSVEPKLPEDKLQAEIVRRTEAIRLYHLRRIITALGGNKELARKVFYDIAPTYAKRNGGYSSVFQLNKRRLKDNAQQAVLMLVEALPSNDTIAANKKAQEAIIEKRKQAKDKTKKEAAKK